MNMPPLKPLHSDDTLSQATLGKLAKRGTRELLDSLRPGQPEALRVRPDGTILNGHHRLKILRERGIDVEGLPREVIPVDFSDFVDPP